MIHVTILEKGQIITRQYFIFAFYSSPVSMKTWLPSNNSRTFQTHNSLVV